MTPPRPASGDTIYVMYAYGKVRPLLYVHVGLPVQPTKVASWPWSLTLKVVSESRVTWYLCANFGLPRPLYSPLRPDVCDKQIDRQTDVRQYHRLMSPWRGHNNSVKRQSISIKSGMQHREEMCYKYIHFRPPCLKTATTLPCEIQKSYFCSLQQYDVRKVKATAENVSNKVSFIFFTDKKIFTVTCTPPWTCNNIECTLRSQSEDVTSVPVVFCVCKLTTFCHSVTLCLNLAACRWFLWSLVQKSMMPTIKTNCWWSYCHPSRAPLTKFTYFSRARQTVELLCCKTLELTASDSPDLYPADCHTWGVMKMQVYRTPSQDVADPRQRLMIVEDEAIDHWQKETRCFSSHTRRSFHTVALTLLLSCFMTALNVFS